MAVLRSRSLQKCKLKSIPGIDGHFLPDGRTCVPQLWCKDESVATGSSEGSPAAQVLSIKPA